MAARRVEMEFVVDGEETLYGCDMCLHFNAGVHDGEIDGVDDRREELKKNVGMKLVEIEIKSEDY